MAEIVGSAVASEAVSRVSSFLSGDKTSHESVEDKAERVEMAVLKIRSVVAVTEDLHISHLPLLQWKAKLKRIADEGDDLLHVHKKQALECDGTTGNNSLSQYLIRAAKRFVPFRRKEEDEDDELSDNTLRRFEMATAMSCLELLPPQFDAASAAIRGLLTETIGASGDRSGLSERSIWCCQRIQSYHRNDCETPTVDRHSRDSAVLLPHSVPRLTTFCYCSPSIDSKDGLPIELECHVSPYLLPEKHSSQLERVGQDVFRMLLPEVTDGFYDDGRQTVDCKRQIWCPQSSMYCSVAPAISQPLTLSQAYQSTRWNAQVPLAGGGRR